MATAQQEIKALKKDLADLKDILAERVQEELPNGTAKNGMPSMDDIKARARHAGVKARKYLRQKQVQARDARDATEKAIQERPFTATAAAFAGGAIVAALLARRH
ncbi:MAG: hypothetical protein EP335_07730 [Alphaproteobacteria bacterium]|nr:MAG: hypothetical protein EP335_07730 [Alphaproteobacteria bacterium]